MALNPGTRLGPYEIVSAIGAGGMGEVYKATDTRLSRVVAIKVLPPTFVADAEMKQRFEREAQTIASLRHPNICVLHDIGSDNGVDFLVMEFLDGETLAERIKRGPVPLDEALEIAIAVTDALDKAHRQNVVHRDLKPSNVMVTTSGPKLLDFGLAKTGAAPDAQALKSGLTTPGMLIGTLQYMAPEQLEGADADARTDIFALGVLLHEMITGKKVFEGKSRVLLMSAIATSEPPPLSTIEPSTPPALEHVVRTCIAKDAADRWQTARDLLAELQAIASGADDGFVAAAASAARRRSSVWPRVIAAAALVAGIVVSVPAYLSLGAQAPPDELRFRIPIQLSAQSSQVNIGGVSASALFRPDSFSVSTDGKRLAFVARSSTADPYLIYVRPVGSVAPQALPGTEDAGQTFWSADNQSIGFVVNNRLRRVEASGGLPRDLCAVSDFSGGTWNREGAILFGSPQGLYRIPAQGGTTPELITTLDKSESGHFWPQFLPDGQHYLYTAWGTAEARTIYLGTLGSKDKIKVLAAESNAAYVAGPDDRGYLVFHRDKSVYARAFDLKTFTLSGEPARIADEMSFDSGNGRGHFTVSHDGVLSYFQNTGGGTGGGGPQTEQAEWHLAWAGRNGQLIDAPGPSALYRGAESSLDTKRIVVHKHEKNGGDIWVIEPTGEEKRLTWDAAQHNASPIWSPEGKFVAFSSVRNGKVGIYQTLSDGSGTQDLLFESELPMAPMSWSPDSKHIVFGVQDPKTGADLWLLTLADKKAAPLIATPYMETHAQISADGRWIAYTSNSQGNRREIHVQAFPSLAGHYQPSTGGGDWPRWRKDGKELFFHSIGINATPSVVTAPAPIGPLYSVAVTGTGSSFEHGPAAEVVTFRALNFPHLGGDYSTYSVSPDGQRFLYFQWVQPTAATATGAVGPDPTSGLMVAMNWTRTVKK